MKNVFVDTAALIAIGNKRDFFHRKAVDVKRELMGTQCRFITTNAVLLEFGNAFSSISLKNVAIKLIEAVRQSEKWDCINIDDVLMEKGIELFKQMQDKEWGLTDCTWGDENIEFSVFKLHSGFVPSFTAGRGT